MVQKFKQQPSIGQEVKAGLAEVDKQNAIANYNKQVDALSTKIVHYSKLNTEVSHQMVEVLLPFLEVAIEMQGIIETVTAINDVINIIGDAINILDTTMTSSRSILVNTTGVKHGFFQRIKQKIEIRRAKANNRRRVKAIVDQIVGFYEMSIEMGAEFATVSTTLRASIDKLKGKKKKKGKASAEATAPQISDNLRKILTDKGADLDGMGYGASSGSSDSSSGGTGGGPVGGSLSAGL